MTTAADYRKTLARTMSESALQAHVIDCAHKFHWLVMHTRPARTADGARWISHISGDVGYPDLTLARGGRVLFIELKRELGSMGPGQLEWLTALGEGAMTLRPHAWLDGTIEKLLR